MGHEDGLLAGLGCERCDGQCKELRVAGTVWLDVYDDGSVPSEASGWGDHEWDSDSPAHCPECGRTGQVSDFKADAAPRTREGG